MFLTHRVGYSALSAIYSIAGTSFAYDGFIVHALCAFAAATIYWLWSRPRAKKPKV
jgi:hypothetical protein